ncbi:MAG: uroporphyrinogen-III synthase, partial [Solirubrobacterales bacterium]|nr:uroporphyrinogen-III synthase [Solirubrobacterales bacterium]
PNGVSRLFEAMAAQGRDARALAQASIAAIGPGTARALAERGVIADVVPERAIAESLIEALAAIDLSGKPVLIARAAQARSILPEALAARGARVDDVAVYETLRESLGESQLEAVNAADYVSFTSSSTVRNLLEVLGGRFPDRARVASIGPVTSETARELGLRVDVEAERHDPDGLVEALIRDAGERAATGESDGSSR